MLWTVFKQQSEKWVPLALSHVSQIIALLHDFIFRLLDGICQDRQIRDQLWEVLLAERLIDVYRKAMDQTRFLLELERSTIPSTLNHYFNSTLQRKRAERVSDALEDKQVSFNGNKGTYVPFDEIKKCAANKSNGQHVCEDLLDSLAAYYKVSRKRFVDVLDQQVVSHLLLNGDGSALQVFGPKMVMSLDCEQLQRIAKEDVESRKRRQLLERDIERLEAAISVIRS
jgi:ribosomal protein L20A (L18A)